MSRVIEGEALKELKPWRVPEFDDSGAEGVSNKPLRQPNPKAGSQSQSVQSGQQEPDTVNLLTAEKIAEIQAQAYREGFDQGREEGHKAGLRDMQSKAKQLETLILKLAKPFEQLDDQVEQELLTLVSTLTRLLVRREIENESGVILGIVQEALQALPVAAREVKLLLHPEDAALVRESLTEGEERPSWRIIEDNKLGRGDCRVISDNSRVDATLETRMNTLIATRLNGDVQDMDS